MGREVLDIMPLIQNFKCQAAFFSIIDSERKKKPNGLL